MPLFAEAPGRLWFPQTVGVGTKNEPAVSSVGRADFLSGKSRPSSVEPQCGQFAYNDVQTSRSDSGHIFKEDKRRLNFFGQAHDFSEKSASLAFQAAATTSNADVLAWKSAVNDIWHHGQIVSLEGTYVIPDRRAREIAESHTTEQDALSVSIVFTIGDWGDPWSQGRSESSDAAK